MTDIQPRGDVERVGDTWDRELVLDVRMRTRDAIDEIASRMEPGMVEEDARKVASGVLRERGLRRGWHAVLVRFGPNTTWNYNVSSEHGVVLGEDDIFLIDIGPIFERCEGDGGTTVAIGGDPEMHAAACDVRTLWSATRTKWLEDSLTGAELYAFAEGRAREMGWRLNLEWSGHRLSEFPHRSHYDGLLSGVGFRPASELWVLEMHIRHPTRPFGAFFEDLLLDDDALQQRAFT